MEIAYREADNNKKVKLNIKSITKIVIASLVITEILIGSGALKVKANETNPVKGEFKKSGYTDIIQEGSVWDAEKQFYFKQGREQAEEEKINADRIVAEQIGYDTYINGENVEKLKNIDTMAELDAYEKGIELAEDSGIMQEKWEQMGYDFISKGKVSDSLDYNSKIPNKLAAQMDAYQKGMKKALEEGNVVDPNNIEPLDKSIGKPTPEQENLEVFRKMLLEGWVEMGKESAEDTTYFSHRNTSSIADSYFSQRSIPISASNLINAGRVQALKGKEVTLGELESLAELKRMGEVKNAEASIKDIAKNVQQEKDNNLTL